MSWSYFDTLKIPLLRGRSFTEDDNGSTPGVIMINEAMAKKYWPKGDPLKDRLLTGGRYGYCVCGAASADYWNRWRHA